MVVAMRAALLILFLASPLAAQQAPAAIANAAWLAGCWRLEVKNRTIDEQWMAPAGSVMLGMSRTVLDGQLQEYELVLLRAQDGRLDYEAHPVRQAAAVFSATHVSDTLLTFENPRHDFPKLVAYQKHGKDSVIARIASGPQPDAKTIRFPYRRIACPSGK
jgi:hypothetical protein